MDVTYSDDFLNLSIYFKDEKELADFKFVLKEHQPGCPSGKKCALRKISEFLEK